MMSLTARIEDNTRRVEQAAEQAAFKNFGHAAAKIRKEAMASIKNAPSKRRAKRRKGKVVRRATHEPSPPGSPPYTQRGQARRAITYHADKTGAVIGPRKSVVGTSMMAHEFGGKYKGGRFPQRPTMGPTLRKHASAFARQWAGSIGS